MQNAETVNPTDKRRTDKMKVESNTQYKILFRMFIAVTILLVIINIVICLTDVSVETCKQFIIGLSVAIVVLFIIQLTTVSAIQKKLNAVKDLTTAVLKEELDTGSVKDRYYASKTATHTNTDSDNGGETLMEQITSSIKCKIKE